MSPDDPKCIKSLELHGIVCISFKDWDAVKEKIEREFVSDSCEGCYLTFRVNQHGNLELACAGDGCGPAQDCCMHIEHDPDRGHRAHCGCTDMEPGG